MLPRDLADASRPSGSTHPVVVGVDGSLAAIGAARWAAAVASKLGAPLHIVHARPPVGHDPSEAVAGSRAIELELQHESDTAILQSASHAAGADCGGLSITTAQVDSAADAAFVDLSRNARLIVLGSDEVSFGTAILIGSTTTTVAAHSICPVVAWRGEMTVPTRQPVVIGVDHDHDSRVAAAAAFEFAYRLGLGVIAVHTWSKRRPVGDATLPSMIDWNQLEIDERQHLSDSVAPLVKLYPDVDVTEVVELDKPRRALLHHARDAQLVVIGSRSTGPLAGALLGSTALNLLHHSAIPVMICHSAQTDE